MKDILKIVVLLVVMGVFGSCLKKDLPETTNSSSNDITGFIYIHKYIDTTINNAGTANVDTQIVVKTQQLNTSISISNDTVYVTPSIPSGFPSSQLSNVTLTNIWGVAYIPDGAIITPVDGAPELGVPGDFSSPASYVVTAANGNEKEWVIYTYPL
ncbi:DUF5018-related domain-containing protein [Parafilimonas sp.]|uniref:DUF5018-related domain-containing protein n=1 Tax=Parafilimonas sp. TaxID=1969739 RepID=UPI0039E32194